MENITIAGASRKYITLKEQNIVIGRTKSLIAAAREKTIPIKQITGVEVKKPGALVNGFIQIQTAGQVSGNSSYKFTGGTFDAVQDENSVVFSGEVNYKRAIKIKKYVENYSENQTTAQLSSADEISKYKKLLDENIITQDEFDAKKKQLLNL